MELWIFILMTWGISNILVNEYILRNPIDWLSSKSKFLNGLFSCETCISLYVGIFVGLLISFDITGYILLNIICYGFIGTGSSNIISYLRNKIEIY